MDRRTDGHEENNIFPPSAGDNKNGFNEWCLMPVNCIFTFTFKILISKVGHFSYQLN